VGEFVAVDRDEVDLRGAEEVEPDVDALCMFVGWLRVEVED